MKKLLLCFFAIIFFAPSAFAADGAVSRVIPTGGAANDAAAVGRGNAGVSRVATRVPAQENDTTATAVRSTVSRVFLGEAAEGAPSSGVVRGNVVSRTAVSAGTNSARSNLNTAVNTVGRNSRVSDASINSNPAVRRAGLVLRPSTAEVGGRAVIGDTGLQTGSNIDDAIRGVGVRAATVTAESLAEATARLEQTATLNKSCQEQYNECMDQFCAVVDANQGRCSCSSNLSKYTKVEEAVKDANTQLNEVAQNIRYVGLSADEIRAIMNATEAEEALAGTKDTSETRSMLEEIEELIRDPVTSSSVSYSSASFADLDVDLDFSADSGNLFSLDFLDTASSGGFAKLRGTELYKAAKSRCNTVLKQCKAAGATINQVTGNYDLAIDKDCIAYEQGLTKMNETLVSNVRSANRMLQKARLAVLQNKNQYDAKGCIGALETCMKDDMVCGEDYFKCVDPTKQYIDENGQVVLGGNISNITAFMQDYNNAEVTSEKIEEIATSSWGIGEETCASGDGAKGACIIKYLLLKIGTGQTVTENGLCRAVLDKCQNYTYDSNVANAKYKPYNDIVVNYIQRAMVNIRAAQQNIISEYASTCMLDIADCYNKQVTQVNAWASNANVANVARVMNGACKNVALTCAYAIDSNCADSGNTSGCIELVSEMFYQSLLCPEYSTYQTTANNNWESDNQYVNAHCRCMEGYESYGNACVTKCDGEYTERKNGVCACKTGYKMVSGSCVKSCPDEANPSGDTCVCPEGKHYDGTANTCVDSGA